MNNTKTEKTSIHEAKMSLRVLPGHWVSDTFFERLLNDLKSCPQSFDEIAFFTDDTHSLPNLEVILGRLPMLKSRMEAVKEAGFSVGVNVLCSMGHHSENIKYRQTGFTPLTDIDGNTSDGVFCPSQAELHDYAKTLYGAIARVCNPEFIWIDDDMRFWGHGKTLYGCFCDDCIRRFGNEIGEELTRGRLKELFNSEDKEKTVAFREKFIEFNKANMNHYIKDITDSFHSVNPDIEAGFMTCENFGDLDYNAIGEILSDNGKKTAKWRPGGGFYEEDVPCRFISKAHHTGRQCASINQNITDIQAEIENFPYALLRKGASVITLETTAYLACGCTGAAFNILPDVGSDIYFNKIQSMRPFYDMTVKLGQKSTCQGISFPWNEKNCVASNNQWPQSLGWSCIDSYLTVGLPACYEKISDKTNVCVISGDQVSTFDNETILMLLSKGLYLDLPALSILNELGFGKYTGFTVKDVLHNDCIEYLTDDPINQGFAGFTRDGRQSFWQSGAGVLLPSEGTRSLSKLIDYSGSSLCDCTTGIFENKLGGRICVSGYCPFDLLYTGAKTFQLKSIFRWLSKETLSAYIASYHKVSLWARLDKDSQINLVLINTSFDPAENLEIAVKTESDSLIFTEENMQSTKISAGKSDDNGYKYFNIPVLMPFKAALLS